MLFTKEFEWRSGETYMFMTSYSNAIDVMMRNGNISELECKMLLHVASWKYFTRLAIQRSCFYKSIKERVRALVKAEYVRVLLLGTEGTQSVYCISPKGDELCKEFYRNLLRVT